MNILLWILIIFLIIAILFLTISLHYIIKKATYLSKKEKEFVIFAVDMYINYAEELDIVPKEKHDLIIKNLKEIKEKYLSK